MKKTKRNDKIEANLTKPSFRWCKVAESFKQARQFHRRIVISRMLVQRQYWTHRAVVSMKNTLNANIPTIQAAQAFWIRAKLATESC